MSFINLIVINFFKFLALLGFDTAKVISKNSFISPDIGLNISIDRSIEIVRSCGWGFRKSLPIRFINPAGKSSSEVLNILASGSSVTRLSEQETKWLSARDILTLNLSHLLDIVPSYCLMQLPLERLNRTEDDDELFWAQYCQLAIESIVGDSERFHGTKFLLRTTSTVFARKRKSALEKELVAKFGEKNIKHLRIISIAAPYESTISDICNRNKELIEDSESDFLLKLGSTLPLAIMTGVALGYTKICLFGCDLLDSTHFYDDESFSSKFDGELRFPAIWNPNKESINLDLFTNTAIRKTTQLEDVAELANWLRENLAVEVRIVNSDTAFSGLLKTVDSSWYEE
jgi:hypothetical protein